MTFDPHISSKGIMNSLRNMTHTNFEKTKQTCRTMQLQLSLKIFDFIVLPL